VSGYLKAPRHFLVSSNPCHVPSRLKSSEGALSIPHLLPFSVELSNWAALKHSFSASRKNLIFFMSKHQGSSLDRTKNSSSKRGRLGPPPPEMQQWPQRRQRKVIMVSAFRFLNTKTWQRPVQANIDALHQLVWAVLISIHFTPTRENTENGLPASSAGLRSIPRTLLDPNIHDNRWLVG
jgi:hypothetical protein